MGLMDPVPTSTFPDITYRLSDGSCMFIPDPEQVKPNYEKRLSTDPGASFPFWARIWPAAKALTVFLQTEPQWTEGKKVIEIGAGLGLPSFTIAAHAASLIISDQAPEAVNWLEKNIRNRQSGNIRAMRIDWNDFPEELTADTVLLSDINYSPDQFGPLLLLIRDLLEKGTDIILSTPQRLIANKFVEALRPYIIRTAQQCIEDEGLKIPISILVLSN